MRMSLAFRTIEWGCLLLFCFWTAAPTVVRAEVASGEQASAGAGNQQTTEARLRQLEDVDEIRRLLASYIRFMDGQDFAKYSQLFTRDGELIFAQNHLKGRDAIRAQMEQGARSSQGGTLVGSSHLLTDVDIDVRGNEASASARWTLLTRGAESRPSVSATGHYADTFTRVDGHWKFKRRVVYADIPHQDPFEEQSRGRGAPSPR